MYEFFRNKVLNASNYCLTEAADACLPEAAV